LNDGHSGLKKSLFKRIISLVAIIGSTHSNFSSDLCHYVIYYAGGFKGANLAMAV